MLLDGSLGLSLPRHERHLLHQLQELRLLAGLRAQIHAVDADCLFKRYDFVRQAPGVAFQLGRSIREPAELICVALCQLIQVLDLRDEAVAISSEFEEKFDRILHVVELSHELRELRDLNGHVLAAQIQVHDGDIGGVHPYLRLVQRRLQLVEALPRLVQRVCGARLEFVQHDQLIARILRLDTQVGELRFERIRRCLVVSPLLLTSSLEGLEFLLDAAYERVDLVQLLEAIVVGVLQLLVVRGQLFHSWVQGSNAPVGLDQALSKLRNLRTTVLQ
mmetsp:Transcript_86520/g.242275  ORF Transcript_86520/g.242275 Transcript_86520/m.242275 type:complete len:276 (+) Transcript_86520:392-1219(+)